MTAAFSSTKKPSFVTRHFLATTALYPAIPDANNAATDGAPLLHELDGHGGTQPHVRHRTYAHVARIMRVLPPPPRADTQPLRQPRVDTPTLCLSSRSAYPCAPAYYASTRL
eukprot:scaffold13265_cov61-Phaeocystis_antarctica.AAC.3